MRPMLLGGEPLDMQLTKEKCSNRNEAFAMLHNRHGLAGREEGVLTTQKARKGGPNSETAGNVHYRVPSLKLLQPRKPGCQTNKER